MEEDVEIELLFKAHGEMLMEAATEYTGNEEINRVCGENSREQEDNVEKATNNTVISKKRKYRRRKRLNIRKKYGAKKVKVQAVNDDSSTDVEELIDTEIVSRIVDSKIKPSHDSDDEIDTCFVDVDESENCINEILDDEFLFNERSAELVDLQAVDRNSTNSKDKCILELKSIQNMIDKRDDIMIKLLRKLDEELIENEKEQSQVREAIKNARSLTDTRLREPSFVVFPFKKFGIPYFHDSSHFPPPPNNDVKKKHKNDELIITSLPKLRYWRKSNKDKLQDAIQLTLINENCDRLVREIEKLQRRLSKITDEQDENEILGKMVECQNQLKRTKNMSYLDLVANENPDREYDWMKYSALDVNGVHSAEECKRFWHLYLKPRINKARWDKIEDEKLKEIVAKYNFQDWESIAQLLGTNRTAYQCFIHYQNRLSDKQEFLVGKWSKEEDEKLLNVIDSAKVGDFIPWTKVATYMGNRNHTQIYNRYMNCLHPKLVKGKFSREEDLLIVSGIEVFGVNYHEMASLMSNRTANQIRERYERYLLPKTAKTGSFSLEEDEQLLRLVDKHGERNFALVADEMKTRSRTQIRQRYNFMMRKIRTVPGWTPAQVKRRCVHNVSKSSLATGKKVKVLKKEVEHVEKLFNLTKLQKDTFRIEKLKELQDNIFMKKYDLSKFKKKTLSENSEINNQLLEFFKYQHLNNPVKSSIRQNSLDNMAYLNEILLLAKYFGHDLQLPESEDEIWKNTTLSYNLKTFLVETLKQREIKGVCNSQTTVQQLTSEGVSHNIDYMEPEVDNTLIMEECWHNASVNVSNLNFSEFFKRTVFDYSSGMHKDIWNSMISRSKVPEFEDVITIAELPNNQPYFIPPNSITTLGYKSVLLSRNRLKHDANKLSKELVDVKTENFTTYPLHDTFQETLLSLFYCPKVLSVTDLSSTLLPSANSKASSSQSITNHEGLVHLLYNSSQTASDIVKKVAQPIKDSALQAKKMKRNVLEHNEIRQRQLQEFKMGITYKRKMSIEHLAKKTKGSKTTVLKTQPKNGTHLKQLEKKFEAGFKAKQLNNNSNSLGKSDSQKTNNSSKSKFDNVDLSNAPLNLPVKTYLKTRQSLKRHSDSDKCSEPVIKKSFHIDSESTTSNLPASPEACVTTIMPDLLQTECDVNKVSE